MKLTKHRLQRFFDSSTTTGKPTPILVFEARRWTSVHERTVRGGRRRRCVGVVVVVVAVVVVGSSTVIQHPAAAAHLQQRLTIVTFLYTKVTPTLSVCSHHHHQRAPSLHTCANTAVLHTSAVCSSKRYFCKYLFTNHK